MGLRLREGIDLVALAQRFGFDTAELIERDKVEFYLGQNLLWQDAKRLGVTEAGMALLDGLLSELVCAELVAT